MRDQLDTGNRTLVAGRIVFNFGQSMIDCVVRRISDEGATIEVDTPLGIPEFFKLLISDGGNAQSCKLVWQSDKQLGVAFQKAGPPPEPDDLDPQSDEPKNILRGSMLALRSALDEIEVGIVLLDANLRAQFINRAFRAMWGVSDAMAAAKPSIISLMYHGRDNGAYQMPADELDAYVIERAGLVRTGKMPPMNLRQSNGQVLHEQCAALPNGGRMLSYTRVTEIVRRSDELERLRGALEGVDEGIVLLDADLNVEFMNQKMRRFWNLTPAEAASRPAYADLVAKAARAYHHDTAYFDVTGFVAKRIAAVRSMDAPSHDLRTADGRHIRVNCMSLENGGRMLTYFDVSDLVRTAEKLETLATTDSMTGLFNRGHFISLVKIEWSRFQRYHRPLSVLMLDADHFKAVNDRYGHAVGDDAIVAVANACMEGKRASDVVGRIGGEEFAMLLPETDLRQASIVAERIRERVERKQLSSHKIHFNVTVSIGVAGATVSMAGFEALLNAADQALYEAKSKGRNCSVSWTPPLVPKLAAE